MQLTDPFGLAAVAARLGGTASLSSYETPTYNPATLPRLAPSVANAPRAASMGRPALIHYAPGSPERMQQLYDTRQHYIDQGNARMAYNMAVLMDMEAHPHKPPEVLGNYLGYGAMRSDQSNPVAAAGNSLLTSVLSTLQDTGTAFYDVGTSAHALTVSPDARDAFGPGWRDTRVQPLADRLTAKAKFRNVQNAGYGHLSYSLLEDLTVARAAEAWEGGLLTGETFNDGLWDMGPRSQHFAYGVSDMAGSAAMGIEGLNAMRFGWTPNSPTGLSPLESTSVTVGLEARPIVSQVSVGLGVEQRSVSLVPRMQTRYWWTGRYSTGASQPGAYVASGGRVFPTRRNSGLSGDALRGAQEAVARIRLLEGHPVEVVRGQAREAGLTVLRENSVMADKGAESAIQRALHWYNSLKQ